MAVLLLLLLQATRANVRSKVRMRGIVGEVAKFCN